MLGQGRPRGLAIALAEVGEGLLGRVWLLLGIPLSLPEDGGESDEDGDGQQGENGFAQGAAGGGQFFWQ